MRVSLISLLLALAGCAAETASRPEPTPRHETADIDGDGHADQVELALHETDGWRLSLTFGGRPHDTRTIDRGTYSAAAPWALHVQHGGMYQPSPADGAPREPISASGDVIVYDRHDGRRMLVWNSPDAGIERIAIR